MLVLTRKINESISIGDTIVLTVLSIEGEKVKIGISAPRELVILRHEVFQAIQDQVKIATFLADKTDDTSPEAFEQLRKLLVSDEEEIPEIEEDHPN